MIDIFGFGVILNGHLAYPADPELAVESISEVTGASKAHNDVVNRTVP